MKLSPPTINDVTHEYFKAHEGRHRAARAAARSRSRSIRRTSSASSRPWSRAWRSAPSRRRSAANGFWISLEPRFQVLDAPGLFDDHRARLQHAERSGDPRAPGDLGRRQGHRDSGAQPLQPADAADAQGGAHGRRLPGPEDPHAGRRADPGRSAEEARRHSGLAAARRGAAGDAEPDHRRHGRRGGAFRCVQVLRHRQADDLSAGDDVRRAGRGQPAFAEIARTGA